MTEAPVFAAVRLSFAGDPWYARVTYADGRTLHSEPWRTQWAAERCAYHMRGRYYRDMAKRGEVGNGETCPLFPEHGNMFVLPQEDGPPMQYCPHVEHDGRWASTSQPGSTPPSRNVWPVYGFAESVQSYIARLDRAIREAGLPDLSDITLED